MKITEDELRAAGFSRAGSVMSDPLKTIRVQIDWDAPGFVVYMMIVNDEVKKVGTTGRKDSSFKKRMFSTFYALRQVITGPVAGRPPARWRSRPLDPFKAHAPTVILSGQVVELWASECATFEFMIAKETELNNMYTPEWTKEGRATTRRGQAKPLVACTD